MIDDSLKTYNPGSPKKETLENRGLNRELS